MNESPSPLHSFTSSSPALCVFAKEPQPDAVKTRLARVIGAEAAALLARAMLLDTVDRLRPFPGDLWIAHDPPEADAAFQDLLDPTGATVPFMMPQAPGNLGARLEAAVARLRERGYGRILLVGTDSPTLPWSSLLALLEVLDTHDFALGPAEDGGFWGLGARRWSSDLLNGLPWSSPGTAAAARARLSTAGTVALVPTWYDVDELDDLRRLLSDPALPYCPHTHRLLHSRWVAPYLEG